MSGLTDSQKETVQAFIWEAIPEGTVLAFAGSADELRHTKGRWLLCNGQECDGNLPKYARLYRVIGTRYGNTHGGDDWFNVPDYRGLFLRGADHPDPNTEMEPAGRDPERDDRRSPIDDTVTWGGRVGSVQEDATARPNNDFVLDSPDNHRHLILAGREPGGENKFARGAGRTGNRPTEPDGDHTHAITGGGDAETQPKNVYVNWIIKY